MYKHNIKQQIYNDKIISLLTELNELTSQLKYETININVDVLDRISFNESSISSITSNKIEGIVITDNLKKDVRELNQILIDNYINILNYIKNHYETINLDLKEILLEHQLPI